MPFFDGNESLTSLDASSMDDFVVGAGAAGIGIATRLAAKGRKVLLIESGHFEHDPERQSLNEIDEIGKPFGDAYWTRKRVLGGTTIAWGGQGQWFPASEFQRRDWIEYSGWPIGFDDLKPYYPIADELMGFPKALRRDLNQDAHPRKSCDFDPDFIHYRETKWANQPNFFKLHRRKLDRDVTVFFNTQLLRIDLGHLKRIEALQVGNFRGQKAVLPIRGNVILATGSIESVRTLLLNDHQMVGGLGNQGGWLGKGFMEHPCVEAGEVRPLDAYRLQQCLGTRVKHMVRHSPKLSGAKVWQEQNRLLGITGGMLWVYPGGETGPLAEMRAFARRPNLRSLYAMARQSGTLFRGAAALATSGLIYKPGSVGRLSLSAEQEPSKDSYIGLSSRTDCFGRRLALTHWKIGKKSWDTIVSFCAVLGAELRRLNLGELMVHKHIRADNPEWEATLSDVNHHLGGARMSSTAAEGVVDPQLRVWGLDNLYVCSAAVFVTGFHSNPTTTVLALGARLADHLTAKA